jgi:putative lipoprotein
MKSLLSSAVSFSAFLFFVFVAVPAHAEGDGFVGATWLVEDIEGRGVIDFLQSTLTFDTDEEVSGMGGCNNFFGSIEIDGNAIEFGPIGATRKACGEAIDDQEFRYFTALAKVRSFEFNQGLLFLLNDQGKKVLRLSRKS